MRLLFSFLAFMFLSGLNANTCPILQAPDLSSGQFNGYSLGSYYETKGGIDLSTRNLGDKRIYNNTGHQDKGISLSWGCAKWILNELLHEQKAPIAVIGAGVNGLTTANVLLDAGFPVTVYTKALPLDTHSAMAHTYWTPSSAPEASLQELYDRLNRSSYEVFLELAVSSNPPYQGVAPVTVYTVGAADSYISKLPYPQRVCASFDKFTSCEAFKWRSFNVDPEAYLTDLYYKAKEKGAFFYQKVFSSEEDLLSLHEHIIINCSGAGPGQIFNPGETKHTMQALEFKTDTQVDYAVEVFKGKKRLFYTNPYAKKVFLGLVIIPDEDVPAVHKKEGHALWKKAQAFFICP